jgi:hypothetical protein
MGNRRASLLALVLIGLAGAFNGTASLVFHGHHRLGLGLFCTGALALAAALVVIFRQAFAQRPASMAPTILPR